MQVDEEVIERVEPSPTMETVEKETTIQFGGTSDSEATVTSFKATIVRSLLRHNDAQYRYVVVERDGPVLERIDDPDHLEGVNGDIVGVSVHLPIGAVSIKGKPRSMNHHSSVVSI